MPPILVDTREQTPLVFEREWKLATLRTGDYSIEGFKERIAIERKSLPDLVACVGRERERFERELVRLAAMEWTCVVVEAPMRAALDSVPQSSVPGNAVVASCLAWMIEPGVPFVFCGGPRLTAAAVERLLVKWFKYRVAKPNKLKGWSTL